MAAPDVMKPAELVLCAAVARRYYLAGRTKVEIAEEFALSRFAVARLLDRARSSGIVRIEIGRPGPIDVELSSRLQDAYGLQHVVVVDVQAQDAAAVREALGAVAADLLMEIVTPQDVLGVAWARAVSAMAEAVTALPAVPVVQLTGSMLDDETTDSSVELVRRLAGIAGGPAVCFYAPMIVPDATTATVLRQQSEVAGAFGRFGTVTKAVAGIGWWSAGESMLYEAATPRERAALERQGVCAEFSGVLVTPEGEPVQTELTGRLIAIDAEQMRAIPEVLAVPYGVRKAPAVLAALRSGMVTSLVTHTKLAEALLDQR